MLFAMIINGAVASVIDGPSGFAIAGKLLVVCDGTVNRGDLYDGTSFTRPAPVITTETEFAPYDFSSLFTPAELVPILLSTDPNVVMARNRVQTIVTIVDLTDPLTVQLMDYLVSIGLVTQVRATQILAGVAP